MQYQWALSVVSGRHHSVTGTNWRKAAHKRTNVTVARRTYSFCDVTVPCGAQCSRKFREQQDQEPASRRVADPVAPGASRNRVTVARVTVARERISGNRVTVTRLKSQGLFMRTERTTVPVRYW